jgi:hypothetical protein
VETPYGVYPLYGGTVAADNKIIVSNGEHSADSPLYRGEAMYVIDADNGTTLWSINGWYQQPSAANGIVVAPNGYDGKIYCFGKGPSQTTVTIQNDVSNWGDSVLVKGMVTDISPGTEQSDLRLRFPNGVPAIADADMTEWMEYLYMQKPVPMDASGVEVILETLDPNNNYYEIGRATSDASGLYSLMFEPLVPGKYTIIARFEGTESYWGSSAETALGVVEVTGGTPIEPEQPTEPVGPIEPEEPTEVPTEPEEPTEVPTEPEQPTEPEPEAPFITTEVAIILAVVIIAIVGVAAYWTLRRRQ